MLDRERAVVVSSNPTCGCGEDAICNETELKCDPCCRCVPQRLCATFESYGCDCDGSSAFLRLNSDGAYTGELICGSEIADIAVLLHSENQRCYWHVVSENNYIDELFEIGPALQSCERPDLILQFSFAECGGTLRITRHELRKLPPRLDEAGCPSKPFCGDCRCTCQVLCVLVSTADGTICFRGELGDVSAGSEQAPKWEGEITCGSRTFPVSLTLTRDPYTDECLFGGSIDGVDLELIPVGDCAELAASWILDDYSQISVSCKECSCDESGSGCCSSRACPGDSSINPLPDTLTLELSATFPYPAVVTPSGSGFSPPPPSDCFNMTITLHLSECGKGFRTYAGVGEKTCSWCSKSYSIKQSVLLTCGSVIGQSRSKSQAWLLTFETLFSEGPCVLDDDYRINFNQHSCDPILLSGDVKECVTCSGIWCQLGAIVIPGPTIVPVIATHAPFCLHAIVFEGP